jgi:hypothetical protein
MREAAIGWRQAISSVLREGGVDPGDAALSHQADEAK